MYDRIITTYLCWLYFSLPVDWYGKKIVHFNGGKNQPFSSDCSNNSCTINVKINGTVLDWKAFLRCWDCLSFLNWIVVFTLSRAAFKNIGALIPWFLFLIQGLKFISINLPSNPAPNNVVNFTLVLLIATWMCCMNYINRCAGLLVIDLMFSLNPCLKMDSISLYFRYFYGRCSSELALSSPLSYSR